MDLIAFLMGGMYELLGRALRNSRPFDAVPLLVRMIVWLVADVEGGGDPTARLTPHILSHERVDDAMRFLLETVRAGRDRRPAPLPRRGGPAPPQGVAAGWGDWRGRRL